MLYNFSIDNFPNYKQAQKDWTPLTNVCVSGAYVQRT